MPAAIVVHAISAGEWPLFRQLRLAALAEAPYAFGSRLADWQGAPEARWRARLTEVPLNLVAELDGRPSGMASGTHPDGDGTVEVISVWIAPAARGRGLGDALLAAVAAWARGAGARRLRLGVTKDNQHALALYLRAGFVDTGVLVDDHGLCERQLVRALD